MSAFINSAREMTAPIVLYVTGFLMFTAGGIVIQPEAGSILFASTILLGLGLQLSAAIIFVRRDMQAD